MLLHTQCGWFFPIKELWAQLLKGKSRLLESVSAQRHSALYGASKTSIFVLNYTEEHLPNTCSFSASAQPPCSWSGDGMHVGPSPAKTLSLSSFFPSHTATHHHQGIRFGQNTHQLSLLMERVIMKWFVHAWRQREFAWRGKQPARHHIINLILASSQGTFLTLEMKWSTQDGMLHPHDLSYCSAVQP